MESIKTLGTLKEPPEVARELLLYIATLFDRGITFVTVAKGLIAERGIGINCEKGSNSTGPLKFRIPLGHPSVFQDAVENRRLYYGPGSDQVLKSCLHSVIGAPHSPMILLLPISMSGNVIALIYADFGQSPPSAVPMEFLEILSRHAGLVLDNSLFQKKFDKITKLTIV
jgi:hypothetical protein